MAKNKAKMNKFLTGAITATMVASAVAPVAALADENAIDFSDVRKDSSHYPNVVKAAERGLMTGYQDGTFKPLISMNRGQVVKALGKYIVGQEGVSLDQYVENHDLVENVTPFTDVPEDYRDQELFKYSLVVKDAQVFRGNNNHLTPSNDITRQQMAQVLVEAFGLEDIEGVDAEVADIDTVFETYVGYVEILAKNEVTQADDGKFRPAESVTRQQMASFLNRSYDAVHGKDEDTEVELNVVEVSAINANTLEVTGAGLDKLEAGDITVEGNGVANVEASVDGETATVTLTGVLAPNKDTKVSVKVGEDTKEFTVNYAFNAPDVAVQDGVYDDDTANQRLTVEVKGQEVSLDYLHTAGYTVEFKAYDAKGLDVTTTLFKNVANGTSKNGVLSTFNSIGKYEVQVVLKKGSEVTTSALANIEIRNLDNASTVSEGYTIHTDQGIHVTDTLVVGETANFTSLFVGNGDTVTSVDLTDVKNYSVTSSNPAALTVVEKVDKSGYDLKATGLGEATVTVKVGNATQTVTLNVKGEARKVAKVTGANVVKPIVTGAATAGNQVFDFTAIDQYGNAVVTPNGKIDIDYPTSVDFIGSASATYGTVGTVKVSLPVKTGGQTGTIVFKVAGTDDVIGTSTIETTAVNNKDNIKLVSNKSDDVINANDVRDDSITYTMEYFTSENVFHSEFGVTDYANHTIKFNDKIVKVEGINNDGTKTPATNGVLTLSANTKEILVTPVKEGSTKFSVYNKVDRIVTERTITVAQPVAAITGINWKNPGVINTVKAVTYEDVLTLTKASVESGSDHIVEGLQFSAAVVNKVRILKTDSIQNGVTYKAGTLYLDKNDDGNFQYDKDTVLGNLEALIAADPSYTNLVAGNVDAMTGNIVGGSNPVKTGSKGNISFILKNNAGDTIATTAVAVDVKPTGTEQEDAQKAQNLTALNNAIANANADGSTVIDATGVLPSTMPNLSITKPMTINFGTKNGHVNVDVTAAGNTTVTGTINTLEVDNGSAHVDINNANITTVNVVNGSTTSVVIDEKSTVGTINVTDQDGIRIENNGTVQTLNLDGTGTVKLDGSGTYPEVEVTGAGTEIEGNATGLVILVNAENVKVNDVAVDSGQVTDEAGADKGTIAERDAKVELDAFVADFTTVTVDAEDATKLVLPTLPEGSTLGVEGDDAAKITISENGEAKVETVDVETTLDVIFTVTKEGYTVKTSPIEIELPVTPE